MRAFDVAGVGFGLIVVPLIAWLLGRVGGRRDWSIGMLMFGNVVAVIAVQLAILAGQCLLEGATSAVGKSFGFLFERRLTEVLVNPEFPAFLFVLGAFVAMLAWSSTPVKKAARDSVTA